MRKKASYSIRLGAGLLFIIAAMCVSAVYPADIYGAGGRYENSAVDQAFSVPYTVSKVKLSAVGDLMLHAKQAEDAKVKGRLDNTYDFDYSFSYIKKYFADSDLVLGNLETVITGKFNDYPMFSAPDEFIYAIKNAGFNILTTANNHSLDRGEAGLLRTIEMLDTLGITHFGTYASQEKRDEITLVTVEGISFAFLSCTYGTNGIPVPPGKPYLVNIMSESLIARDIARAKELNPDFIIVTPHMGNEYETTTKQVFKNWALFMLNAGADIVLASHPHVLQPAEFITVTEADGTERTCFVAYSMGNFVSSQRTLPRDAGIIFNLYFEKPYEGKAVLKRVSFVPTWVKYYGAESGYDIAVLPVSEVLMNHYSGEPVDLRAQDINRLKAVQAETTKKILGYSPSELRGEYTVQFKR